MKTKGSANHAKELLGDPGEILSDEQYNDWIADNYEKIKEWVTIQGGIGTIALILSLDYTDAGVHLCTEAHDLSEGIEVEKDATILAIAITSTATVEAGPDAREEDLKLVGETVLAFSCSTFDQRFRMVRSAVKREGNQVVGFGEAMVSDDHREGANSTEMIDRFWESYKAVLGMNFETEETAN